MEYKKIYKDNVFDIYKYQIKKLKNENKQLKVENQKLKLQLEDKVLNQRIKEAIRKLNSARNHYYTEKENNAIDLTIKILKGE
jgi:regulator of replication initiation timing